MFKNSLLLSLCLVGSLSAATLKLTTLRIGTHRSGTAAPYAAVGGDHDAVSTWFQREGDLTGNTDGTAGTISCWFSCDGSDGAEQVIFQGANGYVVLKKQAGNDFRVQLQDTSGTVRARLDQNTAVVPAFTSGSGWHHIVASWDVAVETKQHLYIDGTNCLTVTTFVSQDVDGDNDLLDYTRTENSLAANSGAGASGWNGCLSEFYANWEYFDLSIATNLAKFYVDSSGPPHDLSAIGSPIVYFKSAWTGATLVNSGSGGNFVQKGTNAVTECNP
jgi:hypothetical protein